MACFIVRAIDSNGSSCFDCVEGQLVDFDNQRILTQNCQSLTRRKSFLGFSILSGFDQVS